MPSPPEPTNPESDGPALTSASSAAVDLAGPSAYGPQHLANIAAALRESSHPKQIGPYHIVGLVAEGGMGAVYKAEQLEPIRRTVAVKVIKLGMDTRDVIARFEAERQALAVMDHPNVARVYDAGATEAGRPYFAMEFVAGEPITVYADRHGLPVSRRLELFAQACAAVQHAHQKGLIHRDLKPSNILVAEADEGGGSGRPTVKVIDFGVAKATRHRLTEKTLFTETGQLLGTPEYMAPEQADGGGGIDVDTRSDVYSLGVVLYELLAGALPFDPKSLRSAGYAEIQRIIREVEPPRPSTRLSAMGERAAAVARARGVEPGSLSRQLERELEWIPLKALRKERDRRYATAAEMAEDVANYLAGRPLRAGPETRSYRARKFVRRNRAGVTAASAMLLLLIAGVVATGWQAVRATRAERAARAERQEAEAQRREAVAQRQKAEEATADARAVNEFLTVDLLGSASPAVTRGRDMTVREAVDKAAAAVAERFAGRPLVEAAVRTELAYTYDALGQPLLALNHARAAERILRDAIGPDAEATLGATGHVGQQLAKLRRDAEAERVLRDVRGRTERVLGVAHPLWRELTGSLAMAIRQQGRLDEAEPLYRQVLKAERRDLGIESMPVAQTLNNLGLLLFSRGNAVEAEEIYRESLAIKERLEGSDHPSTLTTRYNLAGAIYAQGRFEESDQLYRDVLVERRRVLGSDHPHTALVLNQIGFGLAMNGRLAEAEPFYREALAIRRVVLPGDHPETLLSLQNLGRTLALLNRATEAEPLLVELLETRRRALPEGHPLLLNTLAALADLYVRTERRGLAEPLYAEIYRLAPSAEPLDKATRAKYLAQWGVCLAGMGRHAEADAPLRRAHAALLAAGQEGAEAMRLVMTSLADTCEATGRPAEAARWRAAAAAITPTTNPATAPTMSPVTAPTTGE